MVVIPFPVLDGPLAPRRSREEAVRAMAQHLVRYDAWRNEQDAMMSLTWSEQFSLVEIAFYFNDARQAAAQTSVAQAMGDS